MKRILLLFILLCTASVASFAMKAKGNGGNQTQRKSGQGPAGISYPMNFVLNGANPTSQPPISTGYYVVDSDDDAGDFWRSTFSDNYVSLDVEPATWRRILSGPNQQPDSYWPTHADGYRYFRNPAAALDSADNAFAGPMPIGFPFYFNGVRYDSFFVSTNGLVTLSNRRYFYDDFGNKVLRETTPGTFTSYDPASDDQRTRSGDGMADLIADNWGMQANANGNPGGGAGVGLPNGGIRNSNKTPLGSFANNSPILAPLWCNTQISTWNPFINQPDDFGQVWFKRSVTGDKLIIYFRNVTPRGTYATIYGNVDFQADTRAGQSGVRFISCSYQVVMNRLDSTVKFVYENFNGLVIVNNRPVPANQVFRYNACIGVRGTARFPNNLPTYSGGGGTAYQQHTTYLNAGFPFAYAIGKPGDEGSTPHDFLVVNFKQWKNVLRVVNISYRTRQLTANADFAFSRVVSNPSNYELLAGDIRLGAIQPVAVLQNLTNSIQGPLGVNYVQQGITFRARFRILNQATARVVYNRLVTINNTGLVDTLASGYRRVTWNGTTATPLAYANNTLVQPYDFIQVAFNAFEPNEFIDDQIGRLRAVVIADPTDSSGTSLGDQWPFDDTTAVQLFVMRRLTEFKDDVSQYHVVGVPMPSVLKWVNIDAEVSDGDENTYNPCPPRGDQVAANNPNFTIKSPVIRLNRMTLDGADANPLPGGDELRSFPIDLRGKRGSVLSIAYQRTGKMDPERGWSDQLLQGPEHRVVQDQVTEVRTPDELHVEFARPSTDGITSIANVQSWRYHPRRGGLAPASDNSAFTLMGGGGTRRGFLETDKDSALTLAQSLRQDLADNGKDFEYRKIYIPVPDSLINSPSDGARNVRFRLRVRAFRHTAPPQPPDDEDNFYIDNVRILLGTEVTDLEILGVQVSWPYTIAPASQATRIPLRIRIANNTNLASTQFAVKVSVVPEGQPDKFTNTKYCRLVTIPYLAGNRDIEIPAPDFDGRKAGAGRYEVWAQIVHDRSFGKDLEPLNDVTYTLFDLRLDDVFAYDPIGAKNDVPEQAFTAINGKGLNLRGYSEGGAAGDFFTPPTYPISYSVGADGGNQSGQLAMRFQLFTQDTVYGYQAWFAEINQDINNFAVALYADGSGIPGQIVVGSKMIRQRGLGDRNVDANDGEFGKYTTYNLKKPVILPPGIYWCSVQQLGLVGIELGASKKRVGMVSTNYNLLPVPGQSSINLIIDKDFRKRNRSGQLINDNIFAYENTIGSSDWNQFMPGISNPGYAHLIHSGMVNGYNTFTRGTWLPLIRPYMNKRELPATVFVDCPIIPVELVGFSGHAGKGMVELLWQTASESSNRGFFVERRKISGGTQELSPNSKFTCTDNSTIEPEKWSSIGFVSSKAVGGNSSTELEYVMNDDKVEATATYQYRLRQVDLDGTQNFSNQVEVSLGDAEMFSLADCTPNPVSDNTKIAFTLKQSADVRLEVLDVLGNVVKSLYTGNLPATAFEMSWNARSESGELVANGTYLYRLTAGSSSETRKMTVIR